MLSDSNLQMIHNLIHSSNPCIYNSKAYNKISTDQYDILYKNDKHITVNDKVCKRLYASLCLAHYDQQSPPISKNLRDASYSIVD